MKSIFNCKPDLDFRGYGSYGSSDWYYELLEDERDHFQKIRAMKLIERCSHGKWTLTRYATRLCEEEARYLTTLRRARTDGFRKWFLDRLRGRPRDGLWIVTGFYEGIDKLLCEKDYWDHRRERND